jgi:8-oxo-dGTP diphosphatase
MSLPTLGVAVDVAVFTVRDHRLDVLLLRTRRAPFEGRWSLPGGRVRVDETVEQAAARLLEEETGLARTPLEQLHTFSELDRDPSGRCVSVAHLAVVSPNASLRTTDKYSAVGWFSAEHPPQLAFDHRTIVKAAVARLRERLSYTNVARTLIEGAFTLGELQRLYEAILGHPLDSRNFQRRVRALELVEETGEIRAGQAHRPARLFRFTGRARRLA